jgi:alcohol dehydrogenase class IV
MEEVVWGKPAAETVAALAQKRGAERVFLMVSGTLNRNTDEIDKLRRALGNKCVGTFDSMPPHTPRSAVIAATEQAREARADLIVTLGGGSITDGAKAVQLCLANDIRTPEAMDCGARAQSGEAADGGADLDPTTLSAGEFSHISGVTDERTKVKELFRHADIVPRAVVLDPR